MWNLDCDWQPGCVFVSFNLISPELVPFLMIELLSPCSIPGWFLRAVAPLTAWTCPQIRSQPLSLLGVLTLSPRVIDVVYMGQLDYGWVCSILLLETQCPIYMTCYGTCDHLSFLRLTLTMRYMA